jgi:hypothetical protein
VLRFSLLIFSRYLFYIQGYYIFISMVQCDGVVIMQIAETDPDDGRGRPRSMGPVFVHGTVVRDYTIITL